MAAQGYSEGEFGVRGVVVTGASTGIGRAIALHLDGLGSRVFAGVRRESDAESLRAAASERLQPIQLDVTNASSIEAAAKNVASELGDAGLWGLVNNAGIAVGGVLEFQDLDDLRRQLEVNVVGVVAVSRAFLPLIRRGRGRLVHIGSNAGYLAAPFVGPYSASKFALEAIADCQRRELRRSGIEVVLVEPGRIATPIWEKARPERDRILAALPPGARELYSDLEPAVDKFIKEGAEQGVPPERVARIVHTALTARRPRTRYRVGLDAAITWWLTRLLPDRAVDAIVSRLTGVR